MESLHDRMPVVLETEEVPAWLDTAATPEQLTALLDPAPSGALVHRPVSTRVNSPKNNAPDLIERAGPSTLFA